MKAYCVDCKASFSRYEDEPWKVRCYNCWKARVGKTTKATVPAEMVWLRENVRGLLQLCHPDKHGGSSLANRLTLDLLELRKDL